MTKANNDLRMLCKGYGIPLWQVAQKLGVSDQTLYRSWRIPLSDIDRKRVLEIIYELRNEHTKEEEYAES